MPKKRHVHTVSDDFYSRVVSRKTMYYMRVFHIETGDLIAERSTGEHEKDKALLAAARIFSTLPIEEMYREYTNKQIRGQRGSSSARTDCYTTYDLQHMKTGEYCMALTAPWITFLLNGSGDL